MKKIVKTPEVVEHIVEQVTEMSSEIKDDGVSPWESLMGETVCVYSLNYIYSGVLSGVNGNTVMLTDAEIVYDTGEHNAKKWLNASKLPCKELFLSTSTIEAFFKLVR